MRWVPWFTAISVVATSLVSGGCGKRKPVGVTTPMDPPPQSDGDAGATTGDAQESAATSVGGSDGGAPTGAGGVGGTAPDQQQPDAGDGGVRTDGNVAGADGGSVDGNQTVANLSCSDLFDQAHLQQYWVDISPDEWAKMNDEFLDVASVLAGKPRETYHPVSFHFNGPQGEMVANAAIRLKGQSSWVLTVQNDPQPKMQFVLSFDNSNPNGKFHGVSKLDLDMPRSDWTFLHERLANNWWRQRGVMAPCSNSGQLFVNGGYYGLYVVEESVGHHLVKEFFPTNPAGNLFKGAVEPDQNNTTPNTSRLKTLQSARDIITVAGLVDLDTSVLEWAGDALLNNGDGYYGGAHNYYVYDQGAKGYVWLPADTDATFDWLAFNGKFTFDDHPIYWWEGRAHADRPDPIYLAVINDPVWRRRYVDAIATQLQHWDVTALQGWIDDWSNQTAQAVKDDPRRQATIAQWSAAVATARDIVARRASYLAAFVSCERDGTGADADGDGVRWCNDCRDDDPHVNPGVSEICGNGVDDNCDGVIDEGCAPDGGVPADAAAPADGGAPVSDAAPPG